MSEAQDKIAEEIAAAFPEGGRKITNDEGQLVETETTTEEPAPQEQTTETEPTTPEKAEESEPQAPQAEEDSEEQLAEDESGKRYVPKSRFDKIYGQKKQLERELQQAKVQAPQVPFVPQMQVPQAPAFPGTVDPRTDQMELELLKATLPQFNSDSEEYSQVLDQLGAQIFNANPGITRLEAARRAIKMAKEVAGTEVKIQSEARRVKALQSDQGIANRVTPRSVEAQPDPSKMSDKEMEAWLKKQGQW